MVGSTTGLENTVLNQAALKEQMRTGSTVRGTILKKEGDLFIQIEIREIEAQRNRGKEGKEGEEA